MRPLRFLAPTLALVAAAVLAAATPARAAGVDFRWRGFISSDARFSLPGYFDKSLTGDHPRFIRNETWLNLRADLGVGRHVLATSDVSLVFTGKRDAGTIAELGDRTKVDPFQIESDALFVTFRDLGTPGFDISLGRMILPWGTGDMFNPTRKLNPLDLEDPLKFGESIANQMLVLEWAPGWEVEGEEDTIFAEPFLQVAVVPVFRGAMLPDSALVAFSEPSLARGRFHSGVMAELFELQEAFASRGGDLSYDVRVDAPDLHLRNVQLGARMGFQLLGLDLSFSYYRGFDDTPRPETVYAEDVTFTPGQSPDLSVPSPLAIVRSLCAPGEDCLTGTNVHNRIDLSYPRIQQLGFDLTTSLPFLADMGLWAEVAVVFHDDLRLQVRTSDAIFPEMGAPLGISATRPDVEVDGGVFVKAVVGVDHSPFPWWYINVQYLHGFVDEFGADHLDDYVVAGSDFKFFDDRLLLRLFGILNLQDQSLVLYPQVTVSPFASAELTLGAFFYFGGEDTKFGSPLTGPSTVFARAKMSF
jgi:hypothetical protein